MAGSTERDANYPKSAKTSSVQSLINSCPVSNLSVLIEKPIPAVVKSVKEYALDTFTAKKKHSQRHQQNIKDQGR